MSSRRGASLARYEGVDQDEKGHLRGGRSVYRLVHRPRRQHPVGTSGAIVPRARTEQRRKHVVTLGRGWAHLAPGATGV